VSTAKKKAAAGIVWFEIPADKPERAKEFYGKLFGWKINPLPGMPEYQHVDTGGTDASPDGGLMKRMYPDHTITNYINVPSVTKFMVMAGNLPGFEEATRVLFARKKDRFDQFENLVRDWPRDVRRHVSRLMKETIRMEQMPSGHVTGESHVQRV